MVPCTQRSSLKCSLLRSKAQYLALMKHSVNRLVRQHVKAAYSSLAVRHVAEQIDKLYWNAAEPLLQEDEAIDDIPRHDADLTLDE